MRSFFVLFSDAANVGVRLQTQPEMLSLQRRRSLILSSLLKFAFSVLLRRALSILLAFLAPLSSDLHAS